MANVLVQTVTTVLIYENTSEKEMVCMKRTRIINLNSNSCKIDKMIKYSNTTFPLNEKIIILSSSNELFVYLMNYESTYRRFSFSSIF